MVEGLRKLGSDMLGEAPWGTHICQFYKTGEDLTDILVPYFRAGLEGNEFCIWITSEPLNEKEAIEAMRRAVPDFDGYLKKKQMVILPHDTWYLKDGTFSAQRVLDAWVDTLNEALKEGFDGLRLMGNTFWLEKKNWRTFINYEERVNRVIGKHRMIAVCTYSLDKCGASEIIDVVGNHQWVLVKKDGRWKRIRSAARVNEALRESEDKYRQLFDNESDAIMVFDAETLQFDDANRATLELYGYSKKEFMALKVEDISAEIEKTREAVREIVAGRFEGNKVPVRYHRKKDGTVFPAEISVGKFQTRDRKKVIGAVRDITERIRAEEERRASESRFRRLYDSNIIGIAFWDKSGGIVDANDAYLNMIGYSRQDLSEGKVRWKDMTPPEYTHLDEKGIAEIESTGVCSLFEKEYIRKDGSRVPILIGGASLQGEITLGVTYAIDITKSKQVEEKLLGYQGRLRSLTSELILVEERERRAIASELHDHVGQTMALAKIKLGTLRVTAPSAGIAVQVAEIERLLTQSIQEARSLVFEISPPILHELGLVAAVEWLAEHFHKLYKISMDFRDDGRPKPLDESVGIFLFKAVQELLVNITKHARTAWGKISVTKEGEKIRIQVEDNGLGFDTSRLLNTRGFAGGFGLFSIRERMEHIGGSFSVDSEPGRGTRVTMTAPLGVDKRKKKRGRPVG